MLQFFCTLLVAALPLAALAPMADAKDGSPVARYYLEQAWPKAPPSALSDLPAAPPASPGAAPGALKALPNAAPGRGVDIPTVDGKLVAPLRAAPKTLTNDGKYVVKGLPGRPK